MYFGGVNSWRPLWCDNAALLHFIGNSVWSTYIYLGLHANLLCNLSLLLLQIWNSESGNRGLPKLLNKQSLCYLETATVFSCSHGPGMWLLVGGREHLWMCFSEWVIMVNTIFFHLWVRIRCFWNNKLGPVKNPDTATGTSQEAWCTCDVWAR